MTLVEVYDGIVHLNLIKPGHKLWKYHSNSFCDCLIAFGIPRLYRSNFRSDLHNSKYVFVHLYLFELPRLQLQFGRRTSFYSHAKLLSRVHSRSFNKVLCIEMLFCYLKKERRFKNTG